MKVSKLQRTAAMLMTGSALAFFPIQGALLAEPSADECAHELLLSYYPPQFVAQTLAKFNVPAGKREGIVAELNRLDKEVVPTVEKKAEAMDPNPLKDPKYRNEAISIFRETLFEIFAGVLRSNGITDDTQIQEMLDDVQQRKAEQFARCMEKYQPDNGPGGEVQTTTPFDE